MKTCDSTTFSERFLVTVKRRLRFVIGAYSGLFYDHLPILARVNKSTKHSPLSMSLGNLIHAIVHTSRADETVLHLSGRCY